MNSLSWMRFSAVLIKEFIQMRRDPLTFAMMVAVPLIQLTLFGYAINTNPKHLPAAISINDPGVFARSLVAALSNSSYFDIIKTTNSPKVAREMLNRGEVIFVIDIPVNFSRDIVRGSPPDLLIETDATDPSASAYALAAINGVSSTALRDDLVGPLASRAKDAAPFNVVTHLLYNPESITQYNIVPGLLGVILTMTMTLITSMAVTRERERGTYENLLAMPATPLEVMLGKIIPYVFVGAIQVALVLLAAWLVFQVPMLGSLMLLSLTLVLFIICNLSVGYTASTLAETQIQAMQMSFFFFLPSIMLSGFMFPFAGMPQWAQAIGQVLPLTHFLRIVRGIMLKGNGIAEIWPDIWPLILFMFAAGTVALLRFRRTLD